MRIPPVPKKGSINRTMNRGDCHPCRSCSLGVLFVCVGTMSDNLFRRPGAEKGRRTIADIPSVNSAFIAQHGGVVTTAEQLLESPNRAALRS